MKYANLKHSPIFCKRASKVIIIDNIISTVIFIILFVLTNSSILKLKEKIIGYGFVLKNLTIINIILAIVGTLLVVYILLFNYFKWKISYYSYNDSYILLYQSLVTKNKINVFYSDIYFVIINQSIIDKLFKLYRLKIYYYGKNSKKNDLEILLDKENVTKILKYMLKNASIDLENNNYDITIGLKNIVKHALLTIPYTKVIIILNAIYILFKTFLSPSILSYDIKKYIDTFVIILGILFPVIYSILKTIIKYFNIKIKKNNKYITIKYGIIYTNICIFNSHVIQGIKFKETLFSKIFKYKLTECILPYKLGKKDKLYFLLPMLNESRITKLINKIDI